MPKSFIKPDFGAPYQCVQCDFSHTDLSKMLGHVASEHPKKKAKASKRKQKPQRLVLPLQGVDKGRFIP